MPQEHFGKMPPEQLVEQKTEEIGEIPIRQMLAEALPLVTQISPNFQI